MSEINVLEQSIFNRIAAGEVVERPASIVKELVENSIDAGATQISIDIKNGGTYIQISDNGKGMDANDLSLAFMPHATSKIKNVQDLDSIATLGFRGEAIPSIASISNMTIKSRQYDNELGAKITSEFGNVSSVENCGSPQGTTVIVKNVFDNVPARKKFLQKDSTEESYITNIVSKIILANFNISIKYMVNGKIVYQSPGLDIESAVYTIYGKEFIKNMHKIDSTMSDISIKGYVCKPHFTKHSKNFQTLIVNGRYVINNDVSYYVYECYQEFLMKRQYPCYVLYLDIPYDLVDVNVHPSKLEIKFVNTKLIRSLITSTINDTVLNMARVPKNLADDYQAVEKLENASDKYSQVSFSSTLNNNIKEYVQQNIEDKKEDFNLKDYSKYYNIDYKNNTMTKKDVLEKPDDEVKVVKIVSNYTKDINELHEHSDIENAIFNKFQVVPKKSIENNDNIEKNNKSSDDIDEKICINNTENIKDTQKVIDSFLDTPNKYVGKLFNTYLMVENGDNVYCIDQHAAHEKLLYDKYVSRYNTNNLVIQDMLVPYTFNVSSIEKENIDEHLSDIKDLGFEIISYGGLTYSLKSIPAICSNLNINEFLTNLLQNLQSKKLSKTTPFKDMIMQMACKSAIKGEMDLTQEQIDYLLNNMRKQNITLFCPHGRPIVVKITKEEIEKWFKRIVS